MINTHPQQTPTLRDCLRPPVPEIAEAARHLDAAVSAHLQGNSGEAGELIRSTNTPAIREWVESLWGRNSPYVQHRTLSPTPSTRSKADRVKARMPTTAEKNAIHLRDGYHCRFCGIPVIRPGVRDRIRKAYPQELPWGKANKDQHAAFQAMWAQYDHIRPHSHGGTNDHNNIVVTCAPCNFGRMSFSLEEVGLADPRAREPVATAWDGLERFR
jgi:hypothetical protein